MLKKTKKENVSLKLYFMVQTNEFRAISKYVRMSPSKIRRVLRQLEGKTYAEALLVLQFMPYTSCRPIIKVLRSATANAKNNFGLDETQLIVKSAFVDKGPTMKRFRPRAQGRAYRILKATSHITIIMAG
jgi:large subunit ribosomal protein L22|tara:strand:+ start:501 stop:890 length:390 start_codon:yes stop_codon:yes gene_type:complete